MLEEVAGINGALRMVVHGANGMWRLVHQYGTDAQKQHWLPRMAEGDTVTFGLTEPDNGTGRDISTTAVRDGDTWVINGAQVAHLLRHVGQDDPPAGRHRPRRQGKDAHLLPAAAGHARSDG